MKYTILLFVSLCIHQCVFAQQRIHVSVNSNQPPILNAAAGNDVTLTGSELTLGDTPAALGGLAPYTYQWLPETGLNDASTPNPVFSGDQPQSYSLVVTDNRGCTARDTINIQIVGFPDLKNDDLLLVYPNPGAGMIRLKMKEGVKQSSYPISLHSASGQLVFKSNWVNLKSEYLIDVSTLASGGYIISIGEGKGLITRKLMINK
jgi:hypothetical protein